MYEDFTTYTEVDPSSRWSQITTRNTGANVQRQMDSYVYKDYTSNFFGDYIHQVDIYCSSQPLNIMQTVVWGVTNSPGSILDMTDGQVVTMGADTMQRYIRLRDIGNGNSATYVFSLSTAYYLVIQRSSTTCTCKIYSDSARTTLLTTLSITCQTVTFRYLEIGASQESGTLVSGWSGYSENLDLALPEMNISSETLNITEEVKTRFNIDIEESLSLGEVYTFTREALLEELIILSETSEVNLSLEKSLSSESASLGEEIIVSYSNFEDINNDIHMAMGEREDIPNQINTVIQELIDIENKINTIKEELEDIPQKINTARLEEFNLRNAFHSVFGAIKDIGNDIRTIGLNKNNIINDFRMRLSWQGVGLAGAQSLGKTYIQVYFNTVEQTDIDVDSISIAKGLNEAHTASFILGRPFDVNKPVLETLVEIKYNGFLLYKGYITSISPGDSPEHIRIECQDKYWLRNRTKVWFRVGHKPGDDREKYHLTIADALTELGLNFNFGNFIPQAIDLFGTGESDAITSLVTESGNFGWYYTELGEARQWIADGGAIVNLERQEIGKNIGLYQIISMNLTESVDNLVNKLRVQMGDQAIHVPGRQGETKEYVTKMFSVQRVTCTPDWDSSLEVLARNSGTGYGFDYHPDGSAYGNVFTKYKFPSASVGDPTIGGDSKWTDLVPPTVEVTRPFGSPSVPSGTPGRLEEGYSIDWEDGQLTLNEPFYYYDKNDKGQISHIGRPHITLILHKIKYITRTETEDDIPDVDITNPLSFITEQVGTYPLTVLGTLNLGGLSIQGGGVYVSRTGSGSSDISYNHTPTWDDTNFATDIAYWNLSRTSEPKITGTIQLTLDALLFYNIDLSKRIMIEGVLEEPLNINSISYNMSDFTVTLDVESYQYYRRSVSMQSHGTGMSVSSVINSTAISS
jgi:hypothetical protein